MPQLRILLVDEDERVRSLTRKLLISLGSNIAFIEVGDIEDARLAFSQHPHIVVTEISFRGSLRSGMTFVHDMRKTYPSIAIIVLTADKTEGLADAAIRRLGAQAFVQKDSAIPHELVDSVLAHIPLN